MIFAKAVITVLTIVSFATNLVLGWKDYNLSAVVSNEFAPGYITGLYYTEWSYFLKHLPSSLPLASITNLYYAFLKIDEENLLLHFQDPALATNTSIAFETQNLGDCVRQKYFYSSISDDWVSTFMRNVSTLTQNAGNRQLTSSGLLGQLSQIKSLNPNIRVSLSVGGAETSHVFRRITDSAKLRDKFAQALATYVHHYGFDGLDLDWEYPEEHSRDNLSEFMRLVRLYLDSLRPRCERYLLTMPLPAEIEKLDHYDLDELSKHVTYYNVMGYDMGGIWAKRALFQSQLYEDTSSESSSSVDNTIRYLLKDRHVKSRQIVLGMPAYGRSFNAKNLYDEADACANLSGIKQEPDECIVAYNKLPPEGYVEVFDEKTGVAYATNRKSGIVVYDNSKTARLKADYVKNHNLAGGVWWDSSGDTYAVNGSRSLLFSFVDQIGGLDSLKKSQCKINPDLYHGDFESLSYPEDKLPDISKVSGGNVIRPSLSFLGNVFVTALLFVTFQL
ncbi:hypothetical protein BRETT_001484 [Brettanomyces bruxellensis]|uniref:chitinase n=1 Tax=Dekkera bruxellensis TaxID=5007 RepID=A0A871R4I9_DEKBR|nr:uncharacterized protein BRETT_001484 [Brettanomyces bruxellensis]QOU18042.1 hypothetical protein BRETT_001484 [Brettanomyces bruxellensis]